MTIGRVYKGRCGFVKLGELLSGVDITAKNVPEDLEITGISMDSRKIVKGCAFIAVPGLATDGHLYIDQAIRAGAALIIAEHAFSGEAPYVLVENSHRALGVIASNFYGAPSKKMKMIGVTGTNGKTTTTYLLKTILEKAGGAKVGLIGTNQNMIGDTVLDTERTTPDALSLQSLLYDMVMAGCQYCVMEVSSHALALGRVDGIFYDAGVFTNLTQDHLDFHETMENYLKAKSRLFEISATGVINLDDPAAAYLLEHAQSENITYSINNNEADVVAKEVKLKSGGVEFLALTLGQIARIRLGIPGQFSVYNALAALACGLSLGFPLEEMAVALESAKGVVGRMEVVPTGKDYTVLIDYAHTPDALENVLSSLRGFAQGRVVALFGCGGDRDTTKRPIMGKIACELADFVIVTSDNPRTEPPEKIIGDILAGMKDTKTPYRVIENRREAIAWALANARPDDILLLAGKGHETYQEINAVKNHFDEREVIRQCLGINTDSGN